MKDCIVSFASHGRENYNQGMHNLIRSLNDCGYEGGKLMYSFDSYVDEYLGVKIERGLSMNYPNSKAFMCHNHNEIPYQFKLAMIQRAREAGYEQVIWCDSTVRMVKDPQPLLEMSKEKGVCVFDNLGHGLAPWISDIACKMLGINMEKELPNLPQIMACVVIFDFTNKVGVEIFEEWVRHSQNGVSFANGNGSERAEFKAHRHDQCILSYLIHKRGIAYEPYGKLVYPPHDVSGEYGNDIYFINKGVN